MFVFISGEALNLIQNDNSLLQHFTFIATFCKHLIGYDFSPAQKGFMVNLIRTSFYNHPTVCSIGSWYKDTLMMQNSNIQIELMIKNHEQKKKKLLLTTLCIVNTYNENYCSSNNFYFVNKVTNNFRKELIQINLKIYYLWLNSFQIDFFIALNY